MNAAAALDRQLERYRQMTGEQRLKIALDLHEMSCNIAREGIRHQNPNASEAEVENLLYQRIVTEQKVKKQRRKIAEVPIRGRLKRLSTSSPGEMAERFFQIVGEQSRSLTWCRLNRPRKLTVFFGTHHMDTRQKENPKKSKAGQSFERQQQRTTPRHCRMCCVKTLNSH